MRLISKIRKKQWYQARDIKAYAPYTWNESNDVSYTVKMTFSETKCINDKTESINDKKALIAKIL